jgi:hypothetical protein
MRFGVSPRRSSGSIKIRSIAHQATINELRIRQGRAAARLHLATVTVGLLIATLAHSARDFARTPPDASTNDPLIADQVHAEFPHSFRYLAGTVCHLGATAGAI